LKVARWSRCFEVWFAPEFLPLEIVSRVLIRYLGDYVDGLDKRQLQISIFGGNVELQDLSLKPSALRKLNLPIVVKAGNPLLLIASYRSSPQSSFRLHWKIDFGGSLVEFEE